MIQAAAGMAKPVGTSPNEVEDRPVHGGGVLIDIDLAGHGPVEAVDQKRRAEPEQRHAEIAGNEGRNRQKAGDDARGREGVDRPGGQHAGLEALRRRIRLFVVDLDLLHGLSPCAGSLAGSVKVNRSK
jgi:hypothetical protein